MCGSRSWPPAIPPTDSPEVTAALQQVRAVTATAVLSVLARAMEEAVAISTAEQTARFFSPPPPPPPKISP